MDQIYQLQSPVQYYAWGGRREEESSSKPYIADLLGLEAPVGRPFAELWIGAHPKDPSEAILAPGQFRRLDELISDDPEFWLGSRLTAKGFRSLPFLLKILDSAEPLSIQAHPDRQLAAVLHERDPNNYPDANHKPEIAIALEPGLEAFCRFREVKEIFGDLRRLPRLAEFLPAPEGSASRQEWLRQAYQRLLTAEPTFMERLLRGVAEDLPPAEVRNYRDGRLLSLLEKYPGDCGCLSPYFLNTINLRQNQAVYLEPGEPHAYLRGVIIECMAASDNVVRAGLTGKFVDRQTLLEMLSYEPGLPEVTAGETVGAQSRLYRTPAPEFQVEIISLKESETTECTADGEVSLLLVLNGKVEFSHGEWQARGARGTSWVWPGEVERMRVKSVNGGAKVVRARTRQ